jgi:RNA polymerase sigma factor (sigma-70 family)
MATSPMGELMRQLRGAALEQDGAALTDGQLLAEYVRRRDAAALEALVRRHGPMVWGVCRRALADDHDAEDAFQATFLVLVRKAASVTPRDKVANWLYGVAHRTALKARATISTRKGRERQVAEMPEPAAAGQAPWDDLLPVLDEELSRLPDRYRTVVVLCDLEGRTRKDVARLLGVPEGTVAAWVARARVMLAQRLVRRGITLSGGTLAALLAPAGVPGSVVSNTVALIAAGKAPGTGTVSVKVAALAEGELRAMLPTRIKVATALFFVAALACGGLAVRGHTAPAVAPAPAGKKEGPKAAPAWKERATVPYEGALHVFSVGLSPDGKVLATGINHFDVSRSGEVALWDARTGKLRATLTGHTELVQSLAFSPDGKRLVTASHDRTVKLWDVAAAKEDRSFTVTDVRGCAVGIAISPDGKALAVGWAKGPRDEGVKLLDVASGKELARFAGCRAAFSPGGKSLATGTGDGVLKLWDLTTGNEQKSVEAHDGPVTFLAFSPDGKTLATVSNADDTVRLWDVATAKQRASLRQATFTVQSLAFTPDGKGLAVGSHLKVGAKVSGAVIIWDTTTGKRLATLPVENGPVTAVAFAPKEGRTLVAASYSALPGGDITNFSKGITKVVLKVWALR